MEKKSSYQPIIGLEIHFELKTKSKMFCSCRNNHFLAKPNIYTCPVCLGLPGALPVPNQTAIDWTILVCLAFDCRINRNFHFDRKHYFYPDLPKGYQISQHFNPLARGGEIPFLLNEEKKQIGISDIHLEEDTGKLIHKGKKTTLADFNRSGVPLVEIVTKPEINSAEEAKACLKRVQQTVRQLGISDCDMEKGSMRLEANISVKKPGQNKLPEYKVEIKNLNSFRFVEKAINYEIKRQTEILKSHKIPIQETRGFNAKTGTTYSQRKKEVAKDYRYFPEPDIPPFSLTEEKISAIKKQLPIMPWEREEEIINKGVPLYQAQILSKNAEKTALFFNSLKLGADPQGTANYLINKKVPEKITAAELVKLIREKPTMDQADINAIVKEIVKENSKAISDYQKGKTAVIGFLIGQVQKKTQGKADPKLTAKLLQQILASAK